MQPGKLAQLPFILASGTGTASRSSSALAVQPTDVQHATRHAAVRGGGSNARCYRQLVAAPAVCTVVAVNLSIVVPTVQSTVEQAVYCPLLATGRAFDAHC